MPNGFGLLGGGGQINTSLIIPFLNDTSKYYLFVSKGLTIHTPGNESTYQYSYSVVDMQLNGGLGDVVNKNTFIKIFANEKMVAVPNANGNDIWWICRDWTNNFYSYKITCLGFQTSNPVISTVGYSVNNNVNILNGGDLKASPDGKYIAICYNNYFEVYQFNNATGILSNPIKIPTDQCYGVEFSSNSKLLYISQTFNDPDFPKAQVAQYNIAIYDSATIKNSLVRVSQPLIPNGFGQPGGFATWAR